MTNQALTKNFPLRLSAADHARLLDAAASCRTNASTLLRQLLCDYLDGTSLAPANTRAQPPAPAAPRTAAATPKPAPAHVPVAAPATSPAPAPLPQIPPMHKLHLINRNTQKPYDPPMYSAGLWRWHLVQHGLILRPTDQIAAAYGVPKSYIEDAKALHRKIRDELPAHMVEKHEVNGWVFDERYADEPMTDFERGLCQCSDDTDQRHGGGQYTDFDAKAAWAERARKRLEDDERLRREYCLANGFDPDAPQELPELEKAVLTKAYDAQTPAHALNALQSIFDDAPPTPPTPTYPDDVPRIDSLFGDD